MEENETINKKQRVYLIVGIVLFLMLILSASYAYFQITSVNNATATTVIGTGEALGTPTLTTNTDSLSLNLTMDTMRVNSNKSRLYASPSGVPIEARGNSRGDRDVLTLNNGRYVLATAQVTGGDISYNCTYNFDVTGSLTKSVTDRSDEYVHIIVTTPKGEVFRYQLFELLKGTKTISGTISDLKPEEKQEFTIESYFFYESQGPQNGMSGNTFTFKVTPKSGTNGFSCTAATTPVITGFAKTLIDSKKMKQTGLEGDGYRFQGTGNDNYCIYDDGYFTLPTDGTCPTLRHVVRTNISTGVKTDMGYRTTACPANNSTNTFECTTLNGTLGNDIPSNYVCFGTTNKSDCTSNPDKYMYRIIGVFPDEIGDQHVKLIKDSTIGRYQWHNSDTDIVNWEESDLYKGINGSYFYTNNNYDYMQNSTWRNKITDWKWMATMNSKNYKVLPSKRNEERPMDFDYSRSQQEIYLFETNRASNPFTTGYWSKANSKIGLINVSDMMLSVPFTTITNQTDLSNYYGNGWIAWIETASECGAEYGEPIDENLGIWTTTSYVGISTKIQDGISYIAANKYCDTYQQYFRVSSTHEVKPVFYLNSDVDISGGTGTSNDPYIIK